jgi:hypothetical protein
VYIIAVPALFITRQQKVVLVKRAITLKGKKYTHIPATAEGTKLKPRLKRLDVESTGIYFPLNILLLVLQK